MSSEPGMSGSNGKKVILRREELKNNFASVGPELMTERAWVQNRNRLSYTAENVATHSDNKIIKNCSISRIVVVSRLKFLLKKWDKIEYSILKSSKLKNHRS